MKHIFFCLIIIFNLNHFLSAHSVSLYEGNVSIKKLDGRVIQPEENLSIDIGDVITTQDNSYIEIIFDDSTSIEVEEKSEVKVRDYIAKNNNIKISINLNNGLLKSLVQKYKELQSKEFEIITPVAVVGVRGTEFITNYDEDKNTEVDVFAGEVEVIDKKDRTKRFRILKGNSFKMDKFRKVIREKLTELKLKRFNLIKARKKYVQTKFMKIRLTKKLKLLNVKLRRTKDPAKREKILDMINHMKIKINELKKNEEEYKNEFIKLRKEFIKEKFKTLKKQQKIKKKIRNKLKNRRRRFRR